MSTAPAGRRRPTTPVRAEVAGAAAATTLLLLVAGCSWLPPMPDPVPTSVVPTAMATTSLLSPDGFDAVKRMAVRVRNVGCGTLSTGSGFAIADHTLVTNKHVVAGSAELELSTYDGRDVKATAASTAALADLALVVTADPLPYAPELAPADPVPGDPVTVVGYPLGGELTVTGGTILRAEQDPLQATLGTVLVTDAPVEPGSSGSAALDRDGRVVGVVYARSDSGYSYLVPVSTLRSMLDDDAAFEPAPTCTQ